MLQNALTVILKLDANQAADALKEFLTVIGQDINGHRNNTHIDFDKFQTIHFMRWVMLPKDDPNQQRDDRYDYLLFTTNYDGDLAAHLKEFIDHAGDALDKIFGSCIGYPTHRTSDPTRFAKDFQRYLVQHSYEHETFYIAYRGEGVRDVKNYIAVRRKIQNFVDLDAVQAFATAKLEPLLEKLPNRPEIMTPLKRVLGALRVAVLIIIGLLDFLWNLVVVFAIRPIRRALRRREQPLNLQLNNTEPRTGIADIEDVVTQNQMTIINHIKPGLHWVIYLKFVLLLIAMAHKYIFTKGDLSGIVTIHFARWVIIDRGRYLFFESNYDGSWENYIGEFVDKANVGLNLVWRYSTPGFPNGGVEDIEGFKKIIRDNQFPTQVFYSAYPKATVRNILNDRAISAGLEQGAVRDWLQRL
ncbi:MAG: hypothetical protein H7Y11_11945 [Armatimonadetes bacterium]|nr:hypothetical protein [Anaerolineae bacterium]